MYFICVDYLVDARYSNMKGYLVPYIGQIYHLQIVVVSMALHNFTKKEPLITNFNL